MTAQRIWDEIESPLLAAKLGVVSTPRAFDVALLREPIVSELMASLSTEREVKAVASRLCQLLSETTDARYCHQHDLAIAVYLRVLDVCAPEHALAPALLALRLLNLWWGKAMAKRIASAPNRAIPFSRKDFVIPASGQVFVRSVITQVSPPVPRSEMTARSRVRGVFVARTDAGRELQELSASPFRIRVQSTGTTG
jgi:hypothetical protein